VTKPTVLLDGSCLADDASATRGFGRYVSALLESVPKDGRITLRTFTRPPLKLPGVRGRHWTLDELSSWAELTTHAVRLGRAASSAGVDVLHQPTAEPPLRSRVPYVQTLHDVIPMLHPDPGFRFERWRWRQRGWAMRKATLVIAITRWSGDLGVRHLGLDPSRIRVVLHGVNPLFTPPARDRATDDPYLVYVGEYGPHKGFAEACEAAQQLAAAGYPHQLRIIGNVSANARPHVEQLLRRTPTAVHLGRLSDDELLAQYQGATALVFSSRAEGFGRPPIEAMATGTPVVAFANSSIPEVVGDGGIIVPDGDVDALTRAIRSLIDSPARWHDVAGAGLRRAHDVFSWDRCACETVDVYLEAVT
jgi:glycosyltransferase involved in cell wall biosynthesis